MRDKPTLEQIDELAPAFQATIPHDYLDEMGHMNVMWYTHLFSRGIRQLLESVGIDQSYVDANNAGTFALEKHVRYLSEVRVGQRIAVYTRVVGRRGSRFHMLQFLVNVTNQRLAAVMETVSTHVDLGIRRSAPMPPAIAERLDEVASMHNALDWPAPLCGVMGLER